MFYNYLKKATLFIICLTVSFALFAQAKVATPVDTISFKKGVVADSVVHDSLSVDSTKKKSMITAPIVYSASDSIILTGTGVAMLYGKGDVTFGDLSIKSDFLRFNMDSSLVHAHGVPDTAGVLQGKPVFKQGTNEFEMDKLDYNLKTKKAFIEQVTTQEGDGYVTSTEAKKDSNDVVCMRNGWYTTCDQHDHPHYYIAMTKAKVTPGKNIISGPAYLVIEDVPLPIFIPFGYFPNSGSYSSGMLMPSFGRETTRGYYLQGMGYYFALSQYFDVAVRGDIYANKSWGLHTLSNYKKIYKFSGTFSVDYQNTKISEQGLNDYAEAKDFKIIWSHRQDAKANPYSTFSAGVNFSTSSYEHNNTNSIYNPSLISQNHKQSSITYTRRWPENPWSVNVSMNATQNSSDSTISLSLPQFSASMARIFPFKRKVLVGEQHWYEKIGVKYTMNMQNSITSKENDLFSKSLVKDWHNGVEHKLDASTSFKAFNIFTLSPTVTYNERWYTSSTRKNFNDSTMMTYVQDTTYGFHRVYDYSFGVSTSTKVYGFFRPWKMVNALFGNKIEAIRHVMTPSVGLSYRPDFGDPRYGYYSSYETVQRDAQGYYAQDNIYSNYEGAIYGTPSAGKNGSVSFGLQNVVDMKLRNTKPPKDEDEDEDATTDTEDAKKKNEKFKKVTLLESLNINTSYNMMVDSMNWSTISVNGRTTLFKGLAISFNAMYDPYSYAYNEYDRVVRSSTSYWTASNHAGIAHLTSASFNTGYSISNETFKRKAKSASNASAGAGFDGAAKPKEKLDKKDGDKKDKDKLDEWGYTKFTMPWNLSATYLVRLEEDLTSFNKDKMLYDLKVVQSLNFSGGVALTDKWKLTFSSGYDFENRDFSYTSIGMTRNLHCWTFSGSVIPIGKYKSYNFTIAVSSAILQDLKWDQRSDPRTNPDF